MNDAQRCTDVHTSRALIADLQRKGVNFTTHGCRVIAWGGAAALTDDAVRALASAGPPLLDLAGGPPPVRLTLCQTHPPDSRLAYLLAEYCGGPDRLRLRVVWRDGSATVFHLPIADCRELRIALARVLRESASIWGKPAAGTRSLPCGRRAPRQPRRG